jgi:hypothetical protein
VRRQGNDECGQDGEDGCERPAQKHFLS